MNPWVSKRNMVAGFAGSVGMMKSLARFQRTGIRILAYHRVLPALSETGRPFIFDEGVISATTKSFYRQMDYVRRNYDVISFKDLLAIEEERNAPPRRPLIITFDDGYRDNYTDAFPVLKEFGMPATIFLATGHMSRTSLFWWDQVAFCFKRTEKPEIVLEEISTDPLPLGSDGERRHAIESVLSWMKGIPETRRACFTIELPHALGVAVPSDIADGMHLSWDEIREMADHGIEFGSHTVTHPVLSNVDDDRLEKEVFESKKAIERELGREAIVFSYPVGGIGNFDC